MSPDSAEWKEQITQGRAPWELVQMPREVASRLSTKDLVSIVMKYPMAGDVMAIKSKMQALTMMRQRFNGLDELLKRQDAGKHLADYLAAMPIDQVPVPGRGMRWPGYIDLWFVSSLLLHDDLLAGLSKEDAERLGRICLRKNRELRRAHMRIEGSEERGQVAFYIIVGRLMLRYNLSFPTPAGPFTVETFSAEHKRDLAAFGDTGVMPVQPDALERFLLAADAASDADRP